MFGLTSLGVVHTAISLVAVIAGLVALARDKEISPRNAIGMTYIVMTVLTCLTGFGIFQHGGFGKPHALGVITLVVLGVAWLARTPRILGRAATYVETVSYSLTFFFHMIPGATETFTRLPTGAPLFSGPEDPALQKVIGTLFAVFLVGAFLQVRRLRAIHRLPPAAGLA
ncbi:hypothetical protein [Variovorax sp. JS1663]|uniref:hypothetical protein n=1 Tax=Variovorax sp. JS1663 TaxID=1851577 RepID=UPI000B347C4E|nr:hypothetical protein [Variovorax sp. JS1663]OUM03449.1 hypothetical protein A8M77_05130 [Variovorax sp. JS1663]